MEVRFALAKAQVCRSRAATLDLHALRARLLFVKPQSLPATMEGDDAESDGEDTEDDEQAEQGTLQQQGACPLQAACVVNLSPGAFRIAEAGTILRQYALPSEELAQGALAAHFKDMQAWLTLPIHLDRTDVALQGAVSFQNIKSQLARFLGWASRAGEGATIKDLGLLALLKGPVLMRFVAYLLSARGLKPVTVAQARGAAPVSAHGATHRHPLPAAGHVCAVKGHQLPGGVRAGRGRGPGGDRICGAHEAAGGAAALVGLQVPRTEAELPPGALRCTPVGRAALSCQRRAVSCSSGRPARSCATRAPSCPFR